MSLDPPDPPLADESIRLLPLGPHHEAGIAALLEVDDVLRNTRVPTRPPPGYAATWLGRFEEGWRDGTRVAFALEAHDGEFLGVGAFVRLDLAAQQGEIGYVVGPAARGRGVATRALRLLTGWGFTGLELERIELWIDVTNPGSETVARRVGYQREGVLRSYWFKEDIRCDFGIWSRLRGETSDSGA